jgi:imidazolonepropionase-like amidohydrolase
MARCHELLRGAIDLHTHSAPSVFDRLLDDVDLAEQARAAGMRAVLYKAHEQDTTGRAALVRRAVPGIEAFGGVVLNHAVGGLNPAAVDTAIKLGARMVWMPTMSSAHHIAFFGGSHFGTRMPGRTAAAPARGLTVLDEAGGLRPEVREILALIAQAGICLSTGHLAPAEIQVLVPAARQAGVSRVLVTHPDLALSGLGVEAQQALASAGAILEKDVNTLGPPWHSTTIEAMVRSIRAVGPAHCVLATDYGQLHSPAPVDGLRIFVQLCLEQGISEAEIRAMVVDNPARLLGLE